AGPTDPGRGGVGEAVPAAAARLGAAALQPHGRGGERPAGLDRVGGPPGCPPRSGPLWSVPGPPQNWWTSWKPRFSSKVRPPCGLAVNPAVRQPASARRCGRVTKSRPGARPRRFRPCWEGYSPVIIEAIDGSVHTPAVIALSKRVAVAANASRLGVVPRW